MIFRYPVKLPTQDVINRAKLHKCLEKEKRGKWREKMILLHLYKISFESRYDPSWRGGDYHRATSRCLSYCENKSSGEYIRLYLITSRWSSKSIGDARQSVFFLSYHTFIYIHIISLYIYTYIYVYISNFTPRQKLSFVSDRSCAQARKILSLFLVPRV